MDEDARGAPSAGRAGGAQPAVILERFRGMLREREEELRLAAAGEEGGGEEAVPPPSAAEVVRMYGAVLAELAFNSKPVITELTIIAGEHRHAAHGIAHAICDRILQVPEDQKLPSLYLLDSIVKNIGRDYVRYFAARLPEVFCEAYNQVHPSLYPAMRHLFGTWSHVFPSSVLRQIEEGLQFSTSGSQHSAGSANMRRSESSSPRPSHGIHVNPKYLEARQQFEHSVVMREMHAQNNVRTIDLGGDVVERNSSESPLRWSGASPKFHDIQHARGVPSSLQLYGQKSSINYDEYDVDNTDMLQPPLGMARGRSPRLTAGHVSSMVKEEGRLLYSKNKALRSLSPPRVGLGRSASPSGGTFQKAVSPVRVIERPSPSHSENEFGPSRMSERNSWSERNWPSVDGGQQREDITVYNFNKQRTRELIDAYGNYKEDVSYYEKLPKVQRLDANGINSEAVTRKWKNSEEEEYVWEDMSPTLADRTRRDGSPFRLGTASVSTRAGLARPAASFLESDFARFNRPSNVQLPLAEDSASMVEERIPILPSDYESLNKKYLDDTGRRNESLLPYHASPHYAHDPWKSNGPPFSSHQNLGPKSRGRVFQRPFMESRATTFGLRFDNASERGVPYSRLPAVRSESSIVETPAIERHLAQRPQSPPTRPVIWPPVHKSQPLPVHTIYPHQKQFQSPFDVVETDKSMGHQGANSSLYLPPQQYDVADGKSSNLNKMLQLPNQQSGLSHLNQQGGEYQEIQGNLVPSAQAQVSSRVVAQPLIPAQTQGQGAVMASILPNLSSGIPSLLSTYNTSDSLLQVHRGVLPPLPPGPPPTASQMGPSSQNIGSVISGTPVSAFSGLISSLMEKGLISLAPPAPPQDSLGVEFNADVLKVRHESAINALYGDLPRQCTTCGLRFRFQEEHSNHMDWHVTKNRISKNRKQKPSRKWFVNVKEWLCGAETLGTDAVPGFMPTETVTEKKEVKELAVPADENQNVCALCGEPFEDFYSDETEEWMYKGAVYLNSPDGDTEGLERSQLGPIVHAVCRSESNKGPGEA